MFTAWHDLSNDLRPCHQVNVSILAWNHDLWTTHHQPIHWKFRWWAVVQGLLANCESKHCCLATSYGIFRVEEVLTFGTELTLVIRESTHLIFEHLINGSRAFSKLSTCPSTWSLSHSTALSICFHESGFAWRLVMQIRNWNIFFNFTQRLFHFDFPGMFSRAADHWRRYWGNLSTFFACCVSFVSFFMISDLALWWSTHFFLLFFTLGWLDWFKSFDF